MVRFRGRSANWMPSSLARQGMSARNVPRGSEDGVDLARHRFGHVLQELPRRLAVCLLDELGHGELAGPVDAREEMELALGGLHLRDAPSRRIASQSPVPLPGRVMRSMIPGGGQWMWKNAIGSPSSSDRWRTRLAVRPSGASARPLNGSALRSDVTKGAPDVRQARDPMPLQASVQRRARQTRYLWLQGMEAVVQRQQCMASECHDRRFLGLGQDRRARLPRACLQIPDRRPFPPLRDRPGIDAQLEAQRRERSSTPLGIMPRMTLPIARQGSAAGRIPKGGSGSLYCCPDGVRGRGAPATNSSHRVSIQSRERIAPSNRGIERLAQGTVLLLKLPRYIIR